MFTVADTPADLLAATRGLAERYLHPEIGDSVVFRAFGATMPLPRDNVVGVAVGVHEDVPLINVYVRKKFPAAQIPSSQRLPREENARRVRVVEAGYLRMFYGFVPTGPVRPLQAGCSVGHAGAPNAGTLGAILIDPEDRRPYILSNNHVLSDVNAFGVGAPVYQPGSLDSEGVLGDPVGTLHRVVSLSMQLPNEIDCATARILDGILSTHDVPHIGRPSDVVAPSVGMKVAKSGRNGYRTGEIRSIAGSAKIAYGPQRLLILSEQMFIEGDDNNPFSDPGDSGALVVERGSGKAVGLVVGGSAAVTVANDFARVLAAVSPLRLA
jgi:hypothetical protein